MKFLLTVFPGLKSVLNEELTTKLHLPAVASAKVRGNELIWVQTSTPAGLLELRLVEDVFVELDSIKLTGKITDLKLLTAVLADGTAVAAALRVYEHIIGRVIPLKSVFRVVAQAEDAPWRQYRRLELQTAVEAGLLRARPNWRLNSAEAPLEVWLHQVGRTAHISLRLTSSSHRNRGGRVTEREAALRPTIAAALVWMSNPGDDDVFLDPMCGSGTILLERALVGRHGLLLGGDIDPTAVKVALANFGPRHRPVRIERMDARRLPFENDSVDKFVSNLPWGHQVGNLDELPVLYTAVLAEAVRVVRGGGKIVLLSSQGKLLKRAILATRGVKLEQTVSNIEVLGRRADIFVLSRS